MTRDDRSKLFLSAARAFQQLAWQPSVDVYRTSSGWLLKFELAGIAADDVQVVASGRAVAVRGVRRDLRVADCQQSYSMEISYNQFERTLELPCDVSEMQVETDYRDGMLVVRLTRKVP